MSPALIKKILNAADRYETQDFINNDPIQFPHRFTDRRDIEVSAFISAWMAYGSRKVFLQILERLHREMLNAGGPFSFIATSAYSTIFNSPDHCLYRFYKQSDYIELCVRLHKFYLHSSSLEEMFRPDRPLADNIHSLCSYFNGVNGIPVPGSTSANKRMYMLLRWMVRKNSPVDFGIWNNITPEQLLIPLDTHVYQTAVANGITTRKSADLRTAIEITDAMREIWPADPAKGDFALYGIGIAPETGQQQEISSCE